MLQSTSSFSKSMQNLEQLNRNSCFNVFVIHQGRILSRFELIFDFLKFKIFQEINIDQVGLDKVRELNYVGYAHFYLQECWDESELKNKADVAVYKQLIEIDSKLGTTPSEQLRGCLRRYSHHRKDLMEV